MFISVPNRRSSFCNKILSLYMPWQLQVQQNTIQNIIINCVTWIISASETELMSFLGGGRLLAIAWSQNWLIFTCLFSCRQKSFLREANILRAWKKEEITALQNMCCHWATKTPHPNPSCHNDVLFILWLVYCLYPEDGGRVQPRGEFKYIYIFIYLSHFTFL